MTDLEIVFIDAYRVPGNIGAMIVDIVYKNNTPNYIQVVQTYVCGSINAYLLPSLTCISSYATSGYYLYRSNSNYGNLQYCPVTMPLTVKRCGTGSTCPTVSSCTNADTLVIGTVPIPRVVTAIPTEEEVFANIGIVSPPPFPTGLSTNKTSARTGESITFYGGGLTPNTDYNIHYGEFPYREHVTIARTDNNGQFEVVAILPSNAVATTTIIGFKACTLSLIPGIECESYGYVSNTVNITISPGIGISPTPGKYAKSYPASGSYSGSAINETVSAAVSKYWSWDETKAVGMEEAVFNNVAIVETIALQKGLTLLTINIDYTEGVLTHNLTISYTYIKPSYIVSGANVGIDINGTIVSLVAPALIYAGIAVGAIIIGLIIYYTLVKVEEILVGPAGGALLLIGVLVAAGYFITKAKPLASQIKKEAPKYIAQAKSEIARLTAGQ